GYVLGPRELAVSRIEVPVRGLPAPLVGLRIVHISDLHVGQHLDVGELAEHVRRVNALQPDLVCVTGDLVDRAETCALAFPTPAPPPRPAPAPPALLPPAPPPPPDCPAPAPRLGAALMLSGHTHGGQLALPVWLGRGARNLAQFISRFDRGLFRDGEATLYVNRGLGFAGQKVRLFTPREIACLELTPGA